MQRVKQIIGIVAVVVLASSSLSASPFKQTSRVAFVGAATAKSVDGSVEFRTPQGKWQTLKPGTHLLPGMFIKTGPKSRSVLLMDQSKSLVQLPPRTVARLRGSEAAQDASSLTGEEARRGFVIRAIRGQADTMEQGKWTPLKVNDFIKVGAAIRTSAESSVDCYSNETGVVLRLLPSSVLVLDPTPILEAGSFQTNDKAFAALVKRSGSARSLAIATE